MDYMTNPLLRYRLTFLSRRTGSVPGEAKSVTSPVTSTKKADFGGLVGKEVVIFFQPNFTGIILRAIGVDWASQNWSRGNLKNGIFSCGPPTGSAATLK